MRYIDIHQLRLNKNASKAEEARVAEIETKKALLALELTIECGFKQLEEGVIKDTTGRLYFNIYSSHIDKKSITPLIKLLKKEGLKTKVWDRWDNIICIDFNEPRYYLEVIYDK